MVCGVVLKASNFEKQKTLYLIGRAFEWANKRQLPDKTIWTLKIIRLSTAQKSGDRASCRTKFNDDNFEQKACA